MNQEIKAKWLAALRSGKYRQTRGALRRPPNNSTDNPGGYCCLGVLCKVVAPRMKWELKGNAYRVLDDWIALPPQIIEGKAGIITDIGSKEYNAYTALSGMNDNGASFLEIADFIEKNL